MKFGRIKRKYQALKKLNQDKILHGILSDDLVQAQIVDLNQKQLYEQGLQADGTPTGEYSPITIAYKQQFGDARGIPGRTDHITGLDTGETYDSMKVESKSEGIIITAEDRNGFFDVEDKGLGLTNESLSEIRPEIRQGIINEVRKALKA
jgi:hypothetical protein